MGWNMRTVDGAGGLMLMASPKGLSVTSERDGVHIVAQIPLALIPTLTKFLIESGAKFGKVWSAQGERP